MALDISFIVPTLNGLHRLKVLCGWLEYSNFNGMLIIVDATIEDQRNDFTRHDFVEYVHAPASSPHLAFFLGLKKVKTKYVALLGDDDFPLLGNVQKLCNFLELNNSFDSARGHAGFVNLDFFARSDAKHRLSNFFFFVQNYFSARYDSSVDLSSEDAIERFKRFADNYIVAQFFISRTAVVKKINPQNFANFVDVNISEISNNVAHVLIARTKMIPGVYLLRGLSAQRPNANKNHPRHKLDTSGAVENDVDTYLRSLELDDAVLNLAKRQILVHRYLSENNRLLSIRPKYPKIIYMKHQFRRIAFVVSGFSVERARFLSWIISYFRSAN